MKELDEIAKTLRQLAQKGQTWAVISFNRMCLNLSAVDISCHTERLLEKLRAEGGCPWDRAQTIESLKKDIKNEYEEVIEAIDKGDYENLKEEL